MKNGVIKVRALRRVTILINNFFFMYSFAGGVTRLQ